MIVYNISKKSEMVSSITFHNVGQKNIVLLIQNYFAMYNKEHCIMAQLPFTM